MFLKSMVVFCLVSLCYAQYNIKSVDPENSLYKTLVATKPHRIRRQTVFGNVSPGNPGATATIGANGNVFNKNGHTIDAQVQVSKNFKPNGPTMVGGGIDYQGPRAGVSVNVNHVHRFGTDVGVSGNANIWKSNDRRSSLDANAGYNRHFGGPSGTGRPNYNGNINFSHRFWR